MIGLPITDDRLLMKYRRGEALIDANLLLLYLVGKTDPRIIARFSRTKNYDLDDFGILEKLLDTFFGTLITTPNILTEVSNLVTKLPEVERFVFFDQMKRSVTQLDETYGSSRNAVEDKNFRTFGLTDAIVLQFRQDVLVLTDDLPLYHLLAKRGRDVVNFTHIRAAMTLL